MASNQILLITGGNTGIGFEVVKALCKSSIPYTILLGGRNVEKATTAAQKAKNQFPQSPSVIKPVQIDIDDDDSITKLFDHVSKEYNRLDILVNNAGTMLDFQLAKGEVTMREAWNMTWNTNVTGTNILTYTFAPLLLKSSDPKLLFVTSGTSSIENNGKVFSTKPNEPAVQGWPKPGFNMPAYRCSKAGLNMLMREWRRMFMKDNVKIWSVSPGYLATALGGDVEVNKRAGAGDPALGGELICKVIEGGRDEQLGLIVHPSGVQPW